jgi:thimet oligopeptidase
VLHDYTNTTVESVRAALDAALKEADELVARAVASVDAPSFAATMVPLDLGGAAAAAGYGPSAFMSFVHPQAAVRDAGQAADEQIAKWRVTLRFRGDLYRAVKAFAATEEAAALTGERRRLLDHWLRDFRRAGHELDTPQQEELERLQRRLVELEVAFNREVNEYQDGITVTREQLAGMPDDYIERLSAGETEGTYRVKLDAPELEPFLAQASDRSLREELFRKSWNRAVEANRPRLAEAIEVRQKIAKLLGQPTWAHHAMELRMAGNPERVMAFYDEVRPQLEFAARDEVSVMQPMLAADGYLDELQAWDWVYYDTQLAAQRHEIDSNLVSEYLPLDAVIDGMLTLTGEVFGLEYRRVEPTNAWHPSVRLYEIRDRASGVPLAHFYMDLFPREGKYNHAAAFPLVVGHRRADGRYEQPVSAIVANFQAPTVDRPSLLRHGGFRAPIETLFHEFGHILHMSLSRAEFARFSGAETEWDFVEAPSQIMEHWVWEPKVLRRFARHFRSGDPLPADLIERMRDARYQNIGLRMTRQIFFGTVDLALHARETPPDLDAAQRETYAVTQLPYPEGTFMLAGFAHLMGGYDAGYYGYLWAEVIGDDLWGRFEAEGTTHPEVGMAYRHAILEPNGSRSGDEMVLDFLGRPASTETYLRTRGLPAAAPAPAAPSAPAGSKTRR